MNSRQATPTIAEIVRIYRASVDLHRAEKSMTLRCHAICRRLVGDCGGDLKRQKAEANKLFACVDKQRDHDHLLEAMVSCDPFLSARTMLHSHRIPHEKQLRKLARELPVWPWVEAVRGFGELGLAQVVGEARDLSRYPTVRAFWKRMGLAVIDGERQRKKVGADAEAQGYSPSRRSVVWNIGDSMVKCRGTYRPFYDLRKQYEVERNPEIRPIVAHARAKRWMEKRLLRDLWLTWNGLPIHADVEASAAG